MAVSVCEPISLHVRLLVRCCRLASVTGYGTTILLVEHFWIRLSIINVTDIVFISIIVSQMLFVDSSGDGFV